MGRQREKRGGWVEKNRIFGFVVRAWRIYETKSDDEMMVIITKYMFLMLTALGGSWDRPLSPPKKERERIQGPLFFPRSFLAKSGYFGKRRCGRRGKKKEREKI